MASSQIFVPYNRDLKQLEELLREVDRTGNFYVTGALETPIPRIEVEGVGVLSFPVPEIQTQQLIQHAARAPYGRGEETILDESVRKVWQLAADQVRLGGKSWEPTFSRILSQVAEGLGCPRPGVSAELYKLLVYDPGGFFKPHRDSEKAAGMFGTLVVVLPSAHRGGELILRHAGAEIQVDLCSQEVSELKFAAFYADCEHEVRPVTQGYRVCLIYNLIQSPTERGTGQLTPPLYSSEIARAGAMLREAFIKPTGVTKLAWLLDHQYSPAGLSFAALKGKDAALAKVLSAGAQDADCAVHLGIIHIEESGAAEPVYHSRSGYGWGRRWRDSYESDEGDVSSDSFEVIEVSDRLEHIDEWIDLQDRPVPFGKLPLKEGEVLPAGALDHEAPDEQRLTEATGNEGASFERSYRRAALVLWPRGRFTEVLLQAGVEAALPHLAEQVALGHHQAAAAIAEKLIDTWEQGPNRGIGWSHLDPASQSSRATMLHQLSRLRNPALLHRFLSGVVTREFDGSENEELAQAVTAIEPTEAGRALSTLAGENMTLFHGACVDLLGRILDRMGEPLTQDWRKALTTLAEPIVNGLPSGKARLDGQAEVTWHRRQRASQVNAHWVADLLDILQKIGADRLRHKAAASFVAAVETFDPATIIVPALELLHRRRGESLAGDPEAGHLWVHAAEFLLTRSEIPPSPPSDWRQPVTIPCRCEDCRELRKFALDGEARVARFRVRQDRRQHLHQQIEQHGLDMTHVTERKGSPQTLICTKTRQRYRRLCDQHRADCANMRVLLAVLRPAPPQCSKLLARLQAARELKPRPAE